MSASLIFAGLQSTFTTIPLFSYDAGVILRPDAVRPWCLFGADAATDQVYHHGGGCHRERSTTCILGCGEPESFCNVWDLSDAPAGRVCGFDYLGNWNAGLRPYRTEDAAQVLAYQSTRGPAVGWTGYNEVAINPWGDDAIDAFFVVDCQPDEANHWLLPAILNRMHASNCAEAHENGRAAHAAFLRDHGVTAAEMPLLMLRRGDWYQPFALWA